MSLRTRIGGAVALAIMASVAAPSASCARTLGRCEGRETDVTCACEADRRSSDGTCCPRWSHFSSTTRACETRSITRRALLRDLGPTGARAVAAAVDGSGRAVVTWAVVENGLSKVLAGEETVDGNAFSIREPAARLNGASVQSSVTAGPGRTATVAWKQVTGADTSAVHVSERSSDGAWHDPERAEDAFSFPPRAFEPSLATTPLGETVLVWNQWSEPIYGVQIATKADGASWTRPALASDVVSPHAFYANSPTPVTSPRGDVLVTWYQAVNEGNLSAFFSERRGPSGSFSHANGDVRLSPPGGDVGGAGGGNPKPALGPRGEAAAAWLQKDEDGRLVPLVASRDPDGPWRTPASTREAFGVRTGNAIAIRAAFASRGTLIVAWTQDLGAGPVLYALRRTPTGAWRDDPDAPIKISTDGAKVQSPMLATGRDGAIVLAWIELDEAGSALRLRRSWDDDGDWGAVETLASSDRFADSPAIAIGGTPERTVIAWTEGHDARLQLASVD